MPCECVTRSFVEADDERCEAQRNECPWGIGPIGGACVYRQGGQGRPPLQMFTEPLVNIGGASWGAI